MIRTKTLQIYCFFCIYANKKQKFAKFAKNAQFLAYIEKKQYLCSMKKFIQILTWLGITAVLTLIAMGVWTILWHGSQETESLKWLQFLQTVATFLLPPVLCAWLWDSGHRPFHWLQMDKGAGWQVFALAISIMVCAIPAINLLADLNGRIRLPESLAGIEAWMKAMEASAMALTERFLAADGIGGLLLNLGLMALLPALAEEMSFRGVLQGGHSFRQ